jgi:tRNA U34 5-methylaminomethyl-2-thiouridine-forming methyltransferase MnmC
MSASNLNLKKVITKDGSVTFFNEAANEHYHTLAGALDEAELKHVEPAKPYFKDNCTICEFCFGLGYNMFAALSYCAEKKFFATVYAFENDLEIMNALRDISLPEKYEKFRKAVIAVLDGDKKAVTLDGAICDVYEKEFETFKIILYLGDAKLAVREMPLGSASVLFFDPFSLRKTPEMWEPSVFKDCFNGMCNNSLLTTYSCSRVVRENMMSAGFVVLDGPVFGRKAPGTIAIKK